MTLTERKKALITLGNFMAQFASADCKKLRDIPHNELFYESMIQHIKKAEEYNHWFTKENIQVALLNWSIALTEKNIEKWLSRYHFQENKFRKIAIIMAGNIPLVGFHDLVSILITGHHALVKLSSKDSQLLPILVAYLEKVDVRFKGRVLFTKEQVAGYDAIIATGSTNTSRYFEYYFKDKPHIIRKNRNSVAVLTGNESNIDLQLLGDDIFRFYGLGCRNVSKLFVPKNYNFDSFFKAIYSWHILMDKQKYANNYDYNKAVFLMSEFKFLDNGFFMLKEDSGYSTPIATCFYETYETLDSLRAKLKSDSDKIQCTVSSGFSSNEVPFGQSQNPSLWEYADGVDTVSFLLKI